MAVTAEFESNWLEMQEKYGAGIDSGEVPVLSPGDIDASVSLPAVKFTAPYVEGGTNIFQDFRHVPMKTFVLAVQAQADAIKAAWEQWFGTGDTSGIQKIWKDWYTQTQDDWTTWFGTEPSATAEGSGVKKEWTTLKTNVQRATNDANTAAATANQAVGRVETAISGANAAASAANSAAERTDTSRQQIEANEQSRQQNEQGRVSAESGRVSQESTRQQNESTRQQNEQTRQSQETAREQQATSDHNRAESDHSTASDDHTQASQDHNASVTATNEASNVDADLTGMTVTIVNRNGVRKSVDLSFDFYASYPSVAAMNADAANIPKCSLVSIATTNKTDPENARIYQKRSDGTMIYVGDLDQASAEAWADWLNNKKPEIDARIATADADHDRAEIDHTTAGTDHTQAGNDHSRAESDHSTADSDHTQAGSDHTRAESDHSTADSDHTQAGNDHTRAETDHSTADSDHTQAGNDHTRAESDHSTATDDHTQAGDDHTRAESDHSTATDDHSQAGQDHTRAEDDHQTAGEDHSASTQAAALATRQAEYAENVADHPPYIADGTTEKPGDVGYVYQWDYDNQEYVRGIRISLDYESMTDAEKQALAADVLAHIAFDDMPTQGSDNAVKSGGLYTALGGRSQLTFASIETCEDIIDELS
jgi:hypothetical protein